jgi:hypothetical protein
LTGEVRFAIGEGVIRTRRQASWLVLLPALLGLSAAGCKKPARTPEEAFRRLERAVAAGNAADFYRALDGVSRAEIASVYNDERSERTIIRAKYPDSAAGPALANLEAAAADDALHYFEKVCARQKIVVRYRKRLGSVSGPIMTRADGPKAVWVARKDGMPFHFVRDPDGSWGFSELDAEWALEKDRASHAVKTVRDNATLYEKAGSP